MKKKIKIACVTGTRADYPRVKSVLKEIKKRDNIFDLYIIATGSHLLKEYGYSIQEIYDDGFEVSHKVNMFENEFNTPYSMTKAVAKCCDGIADALNDIQPDLALITVDRVETLAATVAASMMNLPIAHIQGGEVTGTIDESIRHAVTKLSHIHFPATEDAQKRIVMMGEDKKYVFNVGCPYIDVIKNVDFVDKEFLANKYNFNPKKKLIIFTQHAVTTEFGDSFNQINTTLDALKEFQDNEILSFYSNTDAGGREIISKIKNDTNFTIIPNMKSSDFLSLMNCADLMIGNSSAAIREAPSFSLPAINIGTRQNGRLRAINVIDTDFNYDQIVKAINKALFDKDFLKSIKDMDNPYGDGKSAKKIVDIIEDIEDFNPLIQKEICYDI